MNTPIQVIFEYCENEKRPVMFKILTPESKSNLPQPSQHLDLNLLLQKITILEQEVLTLTSTNIFLSSANHSLSCDKQTLTSEIVSLKFSFYESEQSYLQTIKTLKKQLKSNEKVVKSHFEIAEDLKQKYEQDFKQKSLDIEKNLIDTQKSLNLKMNQVFKLSQILKEKEQKRSSAEIIVDELEKKNTEFIEKNAKNEKLIFDQEKKINELNKRIQTLTAELKSADELMQQREIQVKKLLTKIKIQEIDLKKLEDELKGKEKKLQDIQKTPKGVKSISEIKNVKGTDVKKVLELLASKEEEIGIMKEMMKNLQNKHLSPSISGSIIGKTNKLPPIAPNSSVRDLQSEKIRPKDIFKVKTNFKIRDIDTKVAKKYLRTSPNAPKKITNPKFVYNSSEIVESPNKMLKNTEYYEETPKFGEDGQNFIDVKISNLDKISDEDENESKVKNDEKKESFEVQKDSEEGEKSEKEEEKNNIVRRELVFDDGIKGKLEDGEEKLKDEEGKESRGIEERINEVEEGNGKRDVEVLGDDENFMDEAAMEKGNGKELGSGLIEENKHPINFENIETDKENKGKTIICLEEKFSDDVDKKPEKILERPHNKTKESEEKNVEGHKYSEEPQSKSPAQDLPSPLLSPKPSSPNSP